ncbi:Lateral signaling target protein 2-like [Acipenser ruthenus]|uniref:Lateral signaling target protein 2 homolog n=1 Tax=Acipenser ruthenus TaxID=7906 RepID=A0A662YV79_ACIRT|nr:Lateral signaling target protein 2-like [Acipenser ruthenus]
MMLQHKRSDPQLLAQFFYADEELNQVAAELDSLDGRKDPQRCTLLVNQFRSCQDNVLSIINQIMDECISSDRANRDFCVKFPEEIRHDNLAGQLWFGAECLAAGSIIMNREIESMAMRPLAKDLTRSLEEVRNIMRDQSLRDLNLHTDKMKESLRHFDSLFAEFELSSQDSPLSSISSSDCESVSVTTCSLSSTYTASPISSLTTSSYTSGDLDHEEIQLALHAAKMAAREKIRSRFHSSSDLIHRLFVCISGVADQLQTNYASDLRNILKTLFEVMATKPELEDKDKQKKAGQGLRSVALEDCALCQECISSSEIAAKARDGEFEDPPDWVPDEACSYCTACEAPFTVIRRKHHCRSCGKIFCSRCSSHSAPLPRYGQVKPVRVCTHCYMFHVTPFYRDKTGI